MKISIIIPNYNGERLLKKNLESVIKSLKFFIEKQKEHGEIVIVDDASTDNSCELIESVMEYYKNKEDPKIILLKNEKNSGFSSTVNNGVKHSSGDIVVLLNTDVRPEIDFLIPLLKNFENQSVFGVGCMDKSIEKGKIVLRGRGVGKWEKGFLVHSAGEIGNKNSTLWVSGGSSAFRVEVWKKLGGFDELFNPFYWEDIDLSYRAKKAGFEVVLEKESKVTHEHELGTIRNKYSPKQVQIIAYRNQFIFIWKNITDSSLLFSHIVWLPIHAIRFGIRGEITFFLGLLKAFIVFPDILHSRIQQRTLFTRTDEDIITETNS